MRTLLHFLLSLSFFYFLCTNSFSQTPVADFTVDKTTVCELEKATFTSTSTGNITSYLWNIQTRGSFSTEGPHSASWLTEGTKTISLTVTGPEGTDTKTMVVTVKKVAGGATITGPAKICKGATGVEFSASTAEPGVFYAWTVPDGSSITSGAGTNKITVDFHQETTSANITLLPTLNGCSALATYSKSIEVREPKTPSTITGPVCAYLNASKMTYEVDNTGWAYNWVVPPGASIIKGQGSTKITVDYSSSAESGNISVYATDNLGCSDHTPTILPVSVSQRPPIPLTLPSKKVCPATPIVTFTAPNLSTVHNGYHWIFPEGTSIINGWGRRTISVAFPDTFTTDTILLNIDRHGNCDSIYSGSFEVTMQPALPVVTVTADPIGFCDSTSVNLFSQVSGGTGVYTYAWTPTEGLNDPTIPNPVAQTSTTTVYTLTVNDGNDCNSTASITVESYKADAGKDMYITEQETVFNAMLPAGCIGTWSILTGTGIIEDIHNPHSFVSGLSTGINIFRWTIVHESCSSYDDIKIEVGNSPSTSHISGPQSVIIGTKYIFSVPFNENERYFWFIDASYPFDGDPSTGDSNVYEVTFIGPATPTRPFLVQLFIENPFGDQHLVLSVNAVLITEISGPDKIEYGNSYQFSVPNHLEETYEWSVNSNDPYSAVIDSGQNTNKVWITFDGPPLSNQAAPLRMNSSPFEVIVYITNPYESKSVSFSVGPDILTSVPNLNEDQTHSYSAFPNPFTDKIIVKVNSTYTTPLSLKILDTMGQIVYSSGNHSTNEDIHIYPQLLPGIYEVHAVHENSSSVFKIVKVK